MSIRRFQWGRGSKRPFPTFSFISQLATVLHFFPLVPRWTSGLGCGLINFAVLYTDSAEVEKTPQYTRNDLIACLEALADDLGQSPTIADLKQAEDTPPLSAFLSEFDSWNAAKEAAGLEAFRKAGRGQPYSDEKLLALLRQRDAELDHPVTLRDMEEAENYPSAVTYQRRFGSWNQAKKEANLDTIAAEDTRAKYTDAELLDLLQDLAADLERPLTVRDVTNAEDYPDPTTFERRFGSWNQAKEEAGLATLEKGEGGRTATYTDDELLDLLRQRAAEVTGKLTEDALNAAPDYPGASTYIRRFGSWTKAKEAAGLDD